jgi:hypothetical protein
MSILHFLLGTNLIIFKNFSLFALSYIGMYCFLDHLFKRKIQFGFNIFIAVWVAFSTQVMDYSIPLAVMLFIVAIVFSPYIYIIFFIRPKKEIPYEKR